MNIIWCALGQGFITGIIFGFLLQRGKLSRFNVVIGQFLLRDFTLMKVMLSAMLVGGVVMHALLATGYIAQLPIEPSNLVGSALGGIIFGIGISFLGYCPGGTLAAVGDGARDALAGVFGLLCGSFIFRLNASWLQPLITPDSMSGTTLATIMSASPWFIFAGLWLMLAGLHLIPSRRLR